MEGGRLIEVRLYNSSNIIETRRTIEERVG